MGSAGDLGRGGADAGPLGDAALTGDGGGAGLGCDIGQLFARPEYACTNAGCHGAPVQAGLDLTSPGLAERLVAVPAQGEGCQGELLVDPDAPQSSLLLRKVDPARYGSTPTCGRLMPPGSTHGLAPEDLACLESYVATIAADPSGLPTSTPIDLEGEWDDVPVESALLKVKGLVNGAPLLASELTLVREDRAALEGLVRQWVEHPGFASKLQRFLMKALQQRALGNQLVDQADILNFPPPIRQQLVANVEEAFARTALRIVQEGRPFSEVATTTRWEMTTALLALTMFTEQTQQEKRQVEHWIYGAIAPPGAPAVPPTLAESVESGFWYAADLSPECEPESLNGARLFDLLYGRSTCPGGSRPYLPVTPLIHDGDYTDWRPVTFEPTAEATERVRFWDLPALRAATSLRVRLPRVGFFTTPAFLDNWATNADNQFRVTASQTMITALGAEFFAGDATEPETLVGLDEVHADPTTVCYGCHARLDPMRNYFTGYFDTDYQALDAPAAGPAGFAFRGAASAGGTIYDFASQVASHPLFASAWVQKLCWYANSQACDESDPAFQAVVDAFVASNLDFKEMAVQLFSSPLVTGLGFSETYRSRRFLVSITRQDHLCARLEQHLAIDAVCDEARQFIGLIPEDEFARGQAEPVETAVTSAFHAAAVEVFCERLARRLVGAADTFPFGVRDPDATIVQIVDTVLGLPEGHSRRDAWLTRLGTHYESALAVVGFKNEAMRSAFALACSSPEVMAVGF